jgi:hypothetical protein
MSGRSVVSINGAPDTPGSPGLTVLFGSGEASPSGRRVWDWLFGRLSSAPKIAILETPAGFQPNSALVAEAIGEFVTQRLRNHQPRITIVPARRRDSPFSPDDPGIASRIFDCNVVFLGPGSPTYAARQLCGSLAWHTVLASHRQGAALVLASAAAIAAGIHVLPVYEIYKAGEDLHWKPGLDLFGVYGLRLVFVTHWNNREGGAGLDTSRAYVGRERFERLLAMLPAHVNIVGIDEHTALVIDIAAESCSVIGPGSVTLLRMNERRKEQRFLSGQSFAIGELGPFKQIEPQTGIPSEVWQAVQSAKPTAPIPPSPTDKVLALVRTRESARARGDWSMADDLRNRILALGWRVDDTPKGPRLTPVETKP